MSKHSIDEIETTRALVAIGCTCGWTHCERKDFDATAARVRARQAFAEHQAGE